VNPSLESLESDVLTRIAAHRAVRGSGNPVRTLLLVGGMALLSGLLVGMAQPHRTPWPRGSERALLADDTRLVPSSLLVSN
jgi:hypothetical protein